MATKIVVHKDILLKETQKQLMALISKPWNSCTIEELVVIHNTKVRIIAEAISILKNFYKTKHIIFINRSFTEDQIAIIYWLKLTYYGAIMEPTDLIKSKQNIQAIKAGQKLLDVIFHDFDRFNAYYKLYDQGMFRWGYMRSIQLLVENDPKAKKILHQESITIEEKLLLSEGIVLNEAAKSKIMLDIIKHFNKYFNDYRQNKLIQIENKKTPDKEKTLPEIWDHNKASYEQFIYQLKNDHMPLKKPFVVETTLNKLKWSIKRSGLFMQGMIYILQDNEIIPEYSAEVLKQIIFNTFEFNTPLTYLKPGSLSSPKKEYYNFFHTILRKVTKVTK